MHPTSKLIVFLYFIKIPFFNCNKRTLPCTVTYIVVLFQILICFQAWQSDSISNTSENAAAHTPSHIDETGNTAVRNKYFWQRAHHRAANIEREAPILNMRNSFTTFCGMGMYLRLPPAIFLTIFAIRQSIIAMVRPTNPHVKHSPKRMRVMPGGENPHHRAHPFSRLEIKGQLR